MLGAVKSIEEAVGANGIDFLVMCQGAIPVGTLTDTVDGIDVDFAVQCLSRFALAFLTASHGTLNDGAKVVTVFSCGASLPDLDVDDLSLYKKRDAGRWSLPLLTDKSRRNSTVIDSFTEELNTKFPKQSFYHIFPGLVKTDIFMNYVKSFSFPLNYIFSLALRSLGLTPTLYANIPVWIAASPLAHKTLGDGRYFNNKLKPVPLGAWAKSDSNRKKLWKKLKDLLGEA